MIRVVLVDDNLRAIEGLRRHIPWPETGCVCAGTAGNGVEALQLCQRVAPDVVITDVKMPLMDGIELCRCLRAEFPDLHLIVISAHDDFAFAQRAMAYGVVNYILKPIDDRKIAEIARLLTQIAQASERHSASLSTFFSSTAQADLAAALHEGDAAAAQALIGQCLSPERLSFQAIKELAATLLAALHQHLAQLGLPAAVAGRTLEQSLVALQTIHAARPMCDYVGQQYAWACQQIAGGRRPKLQTLVEKAKQYMREHYADPEISTYAIARRLHISQSYLCQAFRSSEQASINTYLTGLRIERACRLLSAGDLPIHEVARLVGYPDAHYFAKVFRKVQGMPPSAYRELAHPHE